MKKAFSYLWPLTKKVNSEFSGELEVTWLNGKKILDTKNANYSYGALHQILDVEIIDWGKNIDFDMIINTTSLGLKNEDQIKLDFSKTGSNKLFYDVIYNPSKTNFLLKGEKLGNKIKNGKMMFIYQAQLAFKIWHNVLPVINEKLLDS